MFRKQTRVLIVGEAVTAAHVIRPLGLALGLSAAGYDITFACDRRYEGLVCNTGLVYTELPAISRELFLSRLDKGSSLYSLEELQGYVRDDLRIIAAVRPDVIVGDFRISMGISAELCSIPYLALSSVHWSAHAGLPLPVPEHWLVDAMGVRLAGLVTGAVVPLFFKFQARAMNTLRESYGLPGIEGRGAPDVYTHGTRTLYLDTPDLYGAPQLGPDEACIGPVLWAPSSARPLWWDDLPLDRPVAWLSAGSSGAGKAMCRVAEVLDANGFAVMASTAGGLTGLPPSVYTASFINGLEAAERADIVVCNGGSGIVYQALAKGRPVLGIPRNMDQYYVMEAVQSRGAGRLIRSGMVTDDSVLSAARDLLACSSYRAAALRQGRAIRVLNPVFGLERTIDQLLGASRQSPDSGKSPAMDPAADRPSALAGTIS